MNDNIPKTASEILYGKCPAMQMFNVFGTSDKPCCYKYMEYCYKIKNCEFKRLITLVNELRRKNNG